jgi:hypothetical protein
MGYQYGEHYSEEDAASHVELSTKAAMEGLSPKEQEQLSQLKKQKAMQEAVNGQNR